MVFLNSHGVVNPLKGKLSIPMFREIFCHQFPKRGTKKRIMHDRNHSNHAVAFRLNRERNSTHQFSNARLNHRLFETKIFILIDNNRTLKHDLPIINVYLEHQIRRWWVLFCTCGCVCR